MYGFVLHPFQQPQASTHHPTHRPQQRPVVGPVGGQVDEGVDDPVDEDQEHAGMVERIQKRSGQPRNHSRSLSVERAKCKLLGNKCHPSWACLKAQTASFQKDIKRPQNQI